MLVPPSVADLATFTGREINSFGPFSTEALSQATLLLYLATGLETYPSDSNLALLAKYGIMEMADKIYLAQPHAEAAASPFQSETIGSYSYSKSVQAVKKGDATGVMWFDMAVNKISKGTGVGASGSIEGMEWDGLEVGPNGRARIVGGSGTHRDYDSVWAWSIDTINPDRLY